MNEKKLAFYAFIGVWFAALPAALAYGTVTLLADPVPRSGLIGTLRMIAHDQPVPAGIVLFTIFEMVLYHYRHSLPLADRVGWGGRSDVPADVRSRYEEAGHLVEEANRILDKKAKRVEREVPASAREDLKDALNAVRETMKAKPFDEAEFHDAFDRAAALVDRHLSPWRKSELREYAESIGLAILVALMLRAFVVEAFKIPSGSMLPTLQIQDHIFVNKFAYGPTIPFTKTRIYERMPPTRGDVAVFEYPDPNPQNPRQDFIKRVIAVPGDVLEVDDGHPIINGWRVPNCRVGRYDYRERPGDEPKSGELFIEYLGEATYLTLYNVGPQRAHEGLHGPHTVKPGEVWVLGDNRDNSSDSRAWNNGRGAGVPFANLKGRAMFVWLPMSRLFFNVMGRPDLPDPKPDHLMQSMEHCISKRPPPSQTVPPPPKAERPR